MSTLAIVLIVVALVVALFVAAGFVARRRYDRSHAGDYARHLAEADRALEEARAADRGWDRALLEQAVRGALADARPNWQPERLELVLVDDRPGVVEDRAHFVAFGGGDQVRVLLSRRQGGHWAAELES